MELKPPKTYLLFPVHPESKEQPSPPKGKQRGVAMIMAILVISLMFIFIAEMAVTSSVSLRLAEVNRNRIKAEYLAKSGANLAIFLLSIDLGLDITLFRTGGRKPASDGRSDLWSMINGLTIGPELVKLMAASGGVKLSEVNDSSIIEVLDQFHGDFTIDIKDEASRINVNYCAIGNGKECLGMITALMSCPVEQEYLQRKGLEPAQLAANIKDWIDLSPTVTEGSDAGSEEEPYGDREPPVEPKNAPFDSLEELRMVAGWDDDLHAIFSSYLTVYPLQKKREDQPKINLNTMPRELVACLFQEMEVDCKEKALLKLEPEKKEDELIDVAGNAAIKERLKNVFCSEDEKDANRFTYRSDVYRVDIKARVGDEEEDISLVVQRGPPDEDDKKSDFNGAFKYLEWKML